MATNRLETLNNKLADMLSRGMGFAGPAYKLGRRLKAIGLTSGNGAVPFLSLQDNEEIKLGSGADILIDFDSANFVIKPAVDDTGVFEIGTGTLDMDLKIFMGSTSAHVVFDNSAALVTFTLTDITQTGTVGAAASSGTGGAGGAVSYTSGVGGTATSTAVGGVGGASSITGGIGGSAVAQTGGAGGAATTTGGVGGADTSGVGGAGGATTHTSGIGGACSGAGTGGAGGASGHVAGAGGAAAAGTGGVGGAATLESGAGGADTSGAGGAGGAVAVTGGVGGAAATGVGGVGGSVTLTPGLGGNGATGTEGAAGDLVMATGPGYLRQEGMDNRFRLVWVAGSRGKPGINGDMQNASESVRMIADVDFEITTGDSADDTEVTFNSEGGITIKTDATSPTSGDNIAVGVHEDADHTGWLKTTWGSDRQVRWECVIATDASIAATIIHAGLKLTAFGPIATDDDAIYFRYEAGVNSGTWGVIETIGAGQESTNDTLITVATTTAYHLVIDIQANRTAKCYIDGALVFTSAALTDTKDFKPYIGVETATSAAKVLHIRGQTISRVYA